MVTRHKKVDRGQHLERFAEVLSEVHLAGVADDPYFQFMLDAAASPLRQRALGQRAMGILGSMVRGRALENSLRGPQPRPWPQLDPSNSIRLGPCVQTGLPVLIPLLHLTKHLLGSGKTGSGKTTAFWGYLRQLVKLGIEVLFMDHKNEGRRTLSFCRRALVLPMDRERQNTLEPVGDSKRYYTALCGELGRAYSLRPETWTKLVTILLRLERGKAPGEPYLSLKDFELVLGRIAATEGRQSLQTAALAVGSVNATLGQAARVRRGPDVAGRWPVTVYECQGLPHRVLQFLSAVRLLRLQLRDMIVGHAEGLRRVYFSDEGSLEFGKELSSPGASGYISPQRRLVTQVRSGGTAVVTGVQTLANTDEVLKANVGSYLCLGTQTAAETREASQLLGMPAERMDELQRLPLGMGYLRCDFHPEPVLVSIPNFDAGRYLSDAEVAERMAPAWRWLDEHTVFSDARDDVGTPLSYREILREDEPTGAAEPRRSGAAPPMETALPQGDPGMLAEWQALLVDILEHPESGVGERYRRRGWSAGRGNRVKCAVTENGLVEAERQVSPRGGRPREILKATPRGRAFLEAYRERQTRE